MESLILFLKRLRIISRYDDVSSLLIYIIPGIILLLLSNIHYFLLIFYFLYLFYLYKRSKVLFFYTLIISLFLFGIYVLYYFIYSSYSAKTSLTGYIADRTDKYILIKEKLHFVKVYIKNPESYEIGKKIFLKVTEYVSNSERNVENTFSYSRYKLSRKIICEYSASSSYVYKNSFSIYSLKGLLVEYIEKNFEDTTIKYLEKLILGMSSFDSTVNAYAQETGIIYLFCISGLHISLFSSFYRKILRKMNVPEEIVSVSLLILLLIYRTITLSLTSITRAIVMISIKEVCQLINKRISKTDCLAISFIYSVFSNPFQILESGLYLTYLSTLIIYLLDEKSYFKMSLSIMIFTTPILLYSNGGVSLFMIIYSLVFNVFFSEIFIPFTYLTLLFRHFGFIYELMAETLGTTLESISSTNVEVSLSIPNIYVLIIIYIILLFLFISKDSIKSVISYTMSLLFVLGMSILLSRYAFFPEVKMIDVGQGDSFLIRSSFATIMIDTGVSDDYHTTVSYLKSENIHALTALFITHSDSDHCGEAEYIEENLRVKNVYTFLDGFHFEYGGLKLDTYSLSSDDENESSMVIYMRYQKTTFLFTGDIEDEGEEYILKKIKGPVTFLKVAHHGSSTSSSTAFLNEFRPKASLISVGLNNSYGHPTAQTVKRLERIGTKIYRSDILGSVTVKLFSNFSILYSYRHDEIIIFSRLKTIGLIVS